MLKTKPRGRPPKDNASGKAMEWDGIGGEWIPPRARLGVCTAQLLDTALVYSLPGCKSAGHSFDSLNKSISEGDKLQCDALREYYISVGCAGVDRGSNHASAAGRLPAIQRVNGQTAAVAAIYKQSGRLLD